jgi:16S rRNA (adenine(1408)-N(1))-methyltransferase
VSVVLPWGSLLAAVARPSVPALRAIRALCRPSARLSIVLGVDAARDARELERLGLASLAADSLPSRLAEGYAVAGFRLASVRPLRGEQLDAWPSTWVRRLAHGRAGSLLEVAATATRPLRLHETSSNGNTRDDPSD